MERDPFGLKETAVPTRAKDKQAVLDDIELPNDVGFSGERIATRTTSQRIDYTLLDGTKTAATLSFTTNYDDYVIWERNNRPEETEIRDLEPKLIKTNGNIQPALARKSKRSDDTTKLEIIYGGRRFRVCKKHNLPFQVIVLEELSDRLAQQYTYQENQARLDIDPIDDALYLKNEAELLREKVDRDIPAYEVAETLGITKSRFSRYMAMTRLPEWLFLACPRVVHDDDTSESKVTWSFSAAYKIALLVEKAQQEDVDLKKAIGSRRFENSDALLKALQRASNNSSSSTPRKETYLGGAVNVQFGKTKSTLKINVEATATQELKDELIDVLEKHSGNFNSADK